MPPFRFKYRGFRIAVGHTKIVDLLETAVALVDDNHTDGP